MIAAIIAAVDNMQLHKIIVFSGYLTNFVSHGYHSNIFIIDAVDINCLSRMPDTNNVYIMDMQQGYQTRILCLMVT